MTFESIGIVIVVYGAPRKAAYIARLYGTAGCHFAKYWLGNVSHQTLQFTVFGAPLGASAKLQRIGIGGRRHEG